MDIFEYAMQMEKEGENYYRQMAGGAVDRGLKSILTMLADEEVSHYKIIEKIRSCDTGIAETKILDDVKNVFQQMRMCGGSFAGLDQISAYKKAQDIEKKSQDFYLEKAEQVEQKYQKEIFLKLAKEEAKHYFLLDNIIEFISEPGPELENAEFYHLGEEEALF